MLTTVQYPVNLPHVRASRLLPGLQRTSEQAAPETRPPRGIASAHLPASGESQKRTPGVRVHSERTRDRIARLKRDYDSDARSLPRPSATGEAGHPQRLAPVPQALAAQARTSSLVLPTERQSHKEAVVRLIASPSTATALPRTVVGVRASRTFLAHTASDRLRIQSVIARLV